MPARGFRALALTALLAAAPAAAAEALGGDIGLRLHTRFASITVSLPDLPDDLRLQRRLEMRALEDAAAFLEGVWAEVSDPRSRDSVTSPWSIPYELRRTVRLTFAGGRLLSLRVEEMAYTGGAHELVSLSGLLWDRRDERELRLSDLLDVEGAEPALRRALAAALRAEKCRRGEQAWCELPESQARVRSDVVEVAEVVAEPGAGARACGLRFLFSPYLLGSFAEGSYELVVPTAVFAPWLRAPWRGEFADCAAARGDAGRSAPRLDSAPDTAR